VSAQTEREAESPEMATRVSSREEAFREYVETGAALWHCRTWDVWACGPGDALPTSWSPQATRFDWFCVIPALGDDPQPSRRATAGR